MPSSKSSLMDDQDSWERLSNVSSTPSSISMNLLQLNNSGLNEQQQQQQLATSTATSTIANNDHHSNDTYNPSLLSIKNVVDHERKTSYRAVAATDDIISVLLADTSVMTTNGANDDTKKMVGDDDDDHDHGHHHHHHHKDGSVHSQSSGSNGYRNKRISISKQDLLSRTKFIMVENWDFECCNNMSGDEIGTNTGTDDVSFCGSGRGLIDGGGSGSGCCVSLDECQKRSSNLDVVEVQSSSSPPQPPSSSSSSFWSQFHIISLTNVLSFLIGCSIGILLNRNLSGSAAVAAAAAAAATASTSTKNAGSASSRLAGFFFRFPKFH